MTLIIPPGFAHVAVELRHENDPDPWYVTFGVSTEFSGADPELIGETAMYAFHQGFQATMSPDLDVTGCAVTIGQDGGEPIITFVTPTTALGGSANDARLPQNCALLVRKNTNAGGRRNKGRMFVPGVLAEGAVSSTGIIDPGAVATYQGYAVAFYVALNDGIPGPAATSIPMFLLHSTGISAVIDPTEVSSLTVDNVISTQRRRLR